MLENGDQRLGIRRGDDDGVDLPRDHLFDKVHLLGEIGLVLDAVNQQVIGGGVGFMMCLAPAAMVLKNSFASDFMTRAICGFPTAFCWPIIVGFPAAAEQGRRGENEG